MDKTEIITPDRVSTGIEGLDFILKGGLPKNRLYLNSGKSGNGKNDDGLAVFARRRAEGRNRTLHYFVREQGRTDRRRKSHGWDLDKLNIFDLTISGDSLDWMIRATRFFIRRKSSWTKRRRRF